MNSTPYTEQRNVITTNIDTVSPQGIVELLHQCNLEVFDGYEQYKGLLDESFCEKLDHLASLIKDIYEDDRSIIVISGCGTSGRIGFLACTFFNELYRKSGKPDKYRYIIAGGNSALVTSIEATEDDPVAGAAELENISSSFDRILFIGITCGLSAPFVGGQLDYCLDHMDKYIPVMIGFNPISMARRIQVPKWSEKRTFYDVASRMEKTSGAIVLNPIIGPEPISGSSRMKGGTATKIILDVLFTLASKTGHEHAHAFINELRNATENMINIKESIANVVNEAGDCLLKNGSVRYLGISTFGIWGMIDASECVPTYNSDYNDIRGYMYDDYFKKNLKSESKDQFIAPALQESTPDDVMNILNSSASPCVVVLIDTVGLNDDLVDRICQMGHKIVWMKLSPISLSRSTVLTVDLSSCNSSKPGTILYTCIAETLLKLTLNTISTGAHILKGKVYQNIMIDVRVSNIKLFYRAVDIIKSLASVDSETAEQCLIQSIHQSDKPISDKTVEQHIETVAANRNHVVPIALLMSLLKFSYTQAKNDILQRPRIRDICLGSFHLEK